MILATFLAPALATDTWSDVRAGIRTLSRTTSDPNHVYVTTVDLSQPEIWLRFTREEERGQTVGAFAAEVGAVVAVNGDWFDDGDYRPTGLAVGHGGQWAGEEDWDGWSFLACGVAKDCWFDTPGAATPFTGRMWNVVGANGARLVIDGAAQHVAESFYDSDLAPRTAAGLSADGLTLLLVVVDGRSSRSVGMTWNGMADLLLELGAWQAAMLDGGGSSTLVIDGAVWNDPSDGSSRVVSNHVGVMVSASIDARCSGQENGKHCTDATHIATCVGGACEDGDCAYYGATCEEDADFAYCVDYRCAAGGQGAFCLDATHLAGCTDGAYGEGDCAYYGLSCIAAWDDAWCASTFYQGTIVGSSFAQTVEIETGGTTSGWFEIQNTGLSSWEPGVTWLAPIPRDEASVLADETWGAPHRAATVTATVLPGETGRFPLTLRGATEGAVTQAFGLVQEGVTWFADAPTGGGPADDEIVVNVRVATSALDDTDTDVGQDEPDTDEPRGTRVAGDADGCGGRGGCGGCGGGGEAALLLLALGPWRRTRDRTTCQAYSTGPGNTVTTRPG